MTSKKPQADLSKLTAVRLREVMYENKLKYQELADKLGVNRTTISHWANGRYTPPNDKAGLMGKLFGVNPMWLMGFDNAKKYEELSKDNPLPNDAIEVARAYSELSDEMKNGIRRMLGLSELKKDESITA